MAPAKPLFDDEELEEEPQLRVNQEFAKRFEVRGKGTLSSLAEVVGTDSAAAAWSPLLRVRGVWCCARQRQLQRNAAADAASMANAPLTHIQHTQ